MKESTKDCLVEAAGYILDTVTVVVIAAVVLGIIMAVSYAARFGWELGALAPGMDPSAPVPPVE